MLKGLWIISFFLTTIISGQQMTPENLISLIEQESDTLSISGNQIQFKVNNGLLICIFDENANRMRIISPIIERQKLTEDQLLNALVANFHSVLDVKYALSDEIIWSVYTHPLKELTEGQVVDAIQQVYAAAITFGDSYSSTNLIFPGNSKKVIDTTKTRVLKKL
ncbi:hypothetical protein [Croceitalea vernalis]|uniref:YbjN domain-containing protein n=1 Tax=Croceitalea vernalis TaxID=3075599 RepID=A0ABU3BKB9_9FLAO|nr:hypothetical protein [Croceitalea sp. P007]MDT0622606.1 hypothetical protein [Croceitalea sp. P007]